VSYEICSEAIDVFQANDMAFASQGLTLQCCMHYQLRYVDHLLSPASVKKKDTDYKYCILPLIRSFCYLIVFYADTRSTS
jgi:hypothetical protein